MFFDLKKKISYKEWNVGFFNAIPEDLVSDNIDLSNITWLRRDSKFHCYADPFILNVSDCTIDLLVEDILLGSKNVATICHLSVDKCTGEIIEKYTLIDDNIHNSYPLIIRGDTLDEVYIVPENSYSTELNVYKYNTYILVNISVLCFLLQLRMLQSCLIMEPFIFLQLQEMHIIRICICGLQIIDYMDTICLQY